MAWFRRRVTASSEQAAIDAGVPADVVGVPGWADPSERVPVTRSEALTVPAVVAAVGVIAGRGSTLPLRRYTGAGEPIPPGPFLSHPEPDDNRPLTRTLFATLQDMALDEHAYWRVLLRDYRGFPMAVARIDPELVSPVEHTVEGIGPVVESWNVAGLACPLGDVIRFTGPVRGGWRRAGARAIRTSMALERAARLYAEEPVPSILLKNESGVDLPPDRVDAILKAWRKGRADHATAYVNAALSATPVGFSAHDLQLVEGRQQNVLEIARLTGVPHGLLGASPAGSSVTYRNLEGEGHQAFDAMHPYLAAIEQRLSGEDVTPRGTTVRFDLTAMLRPDTSTLVDMIARLSPESGSHTLTTPESRAMLGLPAESPIAGDDPIPSPADAPTVDPSSVPTPGSGAPG